MTTLVLGATGATGRLLVGQLLERGGRVVAVTRSAERLREAVGEHAALSVVVETVHEASDARLGELVSGCDAVACCLGHNLTLRGVFGPPRRLVSDTVRRVSEALQAHEPASPVRFVLMNTTGARDPGVDPPRGWAEAAVIGLLRSLVPPHPDNEQAADHLRTRIGQDRAAIEWVVVRPDSLIDRDGVSDYAVHASPTRSAIFDAGKTSRVNVAHFMADLLTRDELWREWRGRSPVIYNTG